MIYKTQIEIAKTIWEQSRTAAQQAYQAWELVIKSQKALMDSMRSVGMPFALTTEQFEKLMHFHSEQYKAALEYMNKISDEYEKLLAQQKATAPNKPVV